MIGRMLSQTTSITTTWIGAEKAEAFEILARGFAGGRLTKTALAEAVPTAAGAIPDDDPIWAEMGM